MNFKIEASESFIRELKRLGKKYPSLKEDLMKLLESLKTNPNQGTPLGKNCFKMRLAVRSKGKGKSGGARVISFIMVPSERVILLSIYDKSDKENISNEELTALIDEVTNRKF